MSTTESEMQHEEVERQLDSFFNPPNPFELPDEDEVDGIEFVDEEQPKVTQADQIRFTAPGTPLAKFDPARILNEAASESARLKADDLRDLIAQEADPEARAALINNLATVQIKIDDVTEGLAFRGVDDEKLAMIVEDGHIELEEIAVRLSEATERYGEDSVTVKRIRREQTQLIAARQKAEGEQTARQNAVTFEDQYRAMGADAVADAYAAERTQAIAEAGSGGKAPWEISKLEAEYATPVTELPDYAKRLKEATEAARAEVAEKIHRKYVDRITAEYDTRYESGEQAPWRGYERVFQPDLDKERVGL